MSKLIYHCSQTGKLISTELVDDIYILTSFETDVPVPSGIYNPVFNWNTQQWSGTSAPAPEPAKPSDVMQAINLLGLQIAKINQTLSVKQRKEDNI